MKTTTESFPYSWARSTLWPPTAYRHEFYQLAIYHQIWVACWHGSPIGVQNIAITEWPMDLGPWFRWGVAPMAQAARMLINLKSRRGWYHRQVTSTADPSGEAKELLALGAKPIPLTSHVDLHHPDLYVYMYKFIYLSIYLFIYLSVFTDIQIYIYKYQPF